MLTKIYPGHTYHSSLPNLSLYLRITILPLSGDLASAEELQHRRLVSDLDEAEPWQKSLIEYLHVQQGGIPFSGNQPSSKHSRDSEKNSQFD